VAISIIDLRRRLAAFAALPLRLIVGYGFVADGLANVGNGWKADVSRRALTGLHNDRSATATMRPSETNGGLSSRT